MGESMIKQEYKNLKLCAFADEADQNLDGQIIALKENDISLLEIRGVNGKNISELTVPEVKDAKAKLDDAGIKVWSIGSPVGKIDINEPFEPHLDLFCRLLETAHTLKASHFRLFSFYGTDGGMEDEVFERLDCFVQKAQGSDVLLCHENESGIYGDISQRCLRIHKQFPSIKAVFDPANFIHCSEDTMEAWDILCPYVEYLHIKDAMPDGTVVPAGHGIGNIRTIIDQFAKKEDIFTEGTLTLEPHLSKFVGLKELEGIRKESKIGSLSYSNQREAFDAAVEALKEILQWNHI